MWIDRDFQLINGHFRCLKKLEERSIIPWVEWSHPCVPTKLPLRVKFKRKKRRIMGSGGIPWSSLWWYHKISKCSKCKKVKPKLRQIQRTERYSRSRTSGANKFLPEQRKMHWASRLVYSLGTSCRATAKALAWGWAFIGAVLWPGSDYICSIWTSSPVRARWG